MTGQWFSPGAPISSINKTDRHDIQVTEILLIVALNTINPNHLRIIFLNPLPRILSVHQNNRPKRKTQRFYCEVFRLSGMNEAKSYP